MMTEEERHFKKNDHYLEKIIHRSENQIIVANPEKAKEFDPNKNK